MTIKQGIRYRSYQGLAGIIQHKLLIGILFTLSIIVFFTMLGIFLMGSRTTSGMQIYILVFVLAYTGAVAGYYLINFMLSRHLQAIDQAETSLTEMVQKERTPRERANGHKKDEDIALEEACGELASWMKENEARQLEFLGYATHEIRSPVATMVSYANMISDPDFRKDEDYLLTASKTIVKQGTQVLQLVEDMLTATKLELQPEVIKMKPFPVCEMVEEVVRENQERAHRPVLLENQAGNVTLKGDELRLREVLNNLIDNALKYSPAEQPVCVQIRRAKAGRQDTADRLEISVRDNGIGIGEWEQGTLFTRFGRIKNDQTLGIPGTGLGLYIAQKIVQSHNGRIKVESKPGRGSTFTIELPYEPA